MFFEKIAKKFNLSETKAKVISNVIWAVAGKVITLLSVLFVGILVARYLGPAQYGKMNYVISIISLFTVLSQFGMDNILVRELSKKEFSTNEILGTSLRLRILLAVTTIVLILTYVLLAAEETDVSMMIMIYSLSMIFQSFDIIRHYFTSIVENEYIVKTEIGRTIFSAGIKIVLLLLKAPLYAFIIALVFDFVFLASGYLMSYRKKGGSVKEWRYNKKIARYLLKTSFPLLLSGGAVVVYQRIDQVMIANMLNDIQLGYFSTAASFVNVVLFIPQILATTVTPILVRYYKEDRERYEKESLRFIRFATWGVIAISLIVMIISYPLIRYTYGLEYIVAVPVLQILVFKSVGMTLSSTSGQLIIIEGIHKYAAIRNLLACGVCVICNYALIPKYGIIGSAWATIVTVMFQGWFANVFITKYRMLFIKQCKAVFAIK